ncbi:MAG TPA: hypothetical protein VGC50_06215 [Gammaproteobacteria bacterium]
MSARDRMPRGICRAALCGVAGVALVAFGRTADAQGLDFDFYRQNVEPMFYRSRGDFLPPDPGEPACVMCHTWQANTPLMLQSLEENADGSVYWTEAQSRRNFEAVSRLVSPGDPDNSRLLRTPLSSQAGGSPLHTGGKVWDSQDDPEWQTLAAWVRTGTPTAAEPATEVDFEFFRACVHPVFFLVTPGGLACVSCHNAEFTQTDPQESWRNVQRLIEPGNPTRSRLLMHPLHPDGGGDYVHNGVRRWRTQDDPEWQMLAAWINGERTGASCGL